MELIVLGAGPAYTDRAGATGAAYLLRVGSSALLLDFGQGSFPRLAAEIEPSALTAVVVSHLHPDHFIDLVPLRHYLRYEFLPPRRITVHAPRELGDRLDALHAQPDFTSAALDVVPLEPGTHAVGTFRIEAARVRHTDDSYAFRVSTDDTGPAIVYSGDVGRAEDLESLIRPGDTLLTEVSFGPGPVPPGAEHLDGPAVGGLADRTKVGQLLLTHLQMGFSPDATIDSVRARFRGPTRFVEPGFRLAL